MVNRLPALIAGVRDSGKAGTVDSAAGR